MQLNSVCFFRSPRSLTVRILPFIAGLLALILAGCATAPPSAEQQTQTSMSAASQAHQDVVATITGWHLEGQLALFDLSADDRNAVYISWQQQPEYTQIRLSHPLKGTLAKVQATPNGAELTTDDSETIYAPTLAALFRYHLRLPLPVALIQQTVLGQLPAQSRNVTFYRSKAASNGAVAGFEIIAAQAKWQVSLAQYEPVTFPSSANNAISVQLPTMIELTSTDYRIKLRVSQWSPTQ